MNIGELFINLGIKGSEKTIGALGSVKKSLGELSSMSLEAKAGILGAMYALERLTAISGQMGTNLTNFAASTGFSAKTLQQWQYAARQAGVSGQEMESTFRSVQKAMADMLLTGQHPKGFDYFASKVGLDMNRVRDTEYVLKKLQEFSQVVPPDLAGNIVQSMGVGSGVFAGMRRNLFRPDVFAHAPIYGDKEVQQLDKANIAWSNLGNKIEMAIGHFNAKYGLQLVQDITKITTQVLKLTDAFVLLANKLEAMKWIGKVFEGWSLILGGASKAVDAFSGKGNARNEVQSFGADIPGALKKILEDALPGILGGIIPKEPNNPNLGSPQFTNSFEINNNFQHPGLEHQKTGDSVKKSVRDAFRQMPAVRQGT